jgi:hypothetical protein
MYRGPLLNPSDGGTGNILTRSSYSLGVGGVDYIGQEFKKIRLLMLGKG